MEKWFEDILSLNGCITNCATRGFILIIVKEKQYFLTIPIYDRFENFSINELVNLLQLWNNLTIISCLIQWCFGKCQSITKFYGE